MLVIRCAHAGRYAIVCMHTMGLLMHASQRGTSSGMDHDCCALQGRRERSKGIDPTRPRQKLSDTTGHLSVVWLAWVTVPVTHNRAGRRCWPRHIMVGTLLPNFVSSLLSSLQQALNLQTSLRFFVSFLPPLFFLFSIIELCSIDLFANHTHNTQKIKQINTSLSCRSTNPLIPN